MKFICLEMLRLLVISNRMELGSHVAHVFILKCYVRPYSIVIDLLCNKFTCFIS